MTKDAVSDWDITTGNTKEIAGTDLGAGCAPGNIKNVSALWAPFIAAKTDAGFEIAWANSASARGLCDHELLISCKGA